jgi:hypothetical protein
MQLSASAICLLALRGDGDAFNCTTYHLPAKLKTVMKSLEELPY